jgi:glycerophosphoryl diester phosphodiesterase
MRSSRRHLIVAAAAIVALVVGTVVTRSIMSKPEASASTPVGDPTNPFRTGRTLVIPHGGGDGLFPENTLLAFERSMAMGADVVDVDLRLSGDGVVIAFHDPTVDRITGTKGSVQKMTYRELSGLDAGWAFAPAGAGANDGTAQHPFRGTGVSIPTLESILQEFPTALLSLDLKDETMAMVKPVCDLLRQHHRFNDVFVGSNSDPQIVEFRKLCPDVRTSAIMKDVYASRDAKASGDTHFVPAVTVDQPPFRVDGREIVDGASLSWSHEHGVAILTWVVNDEADMRLLVGLGVDGIYTSYPDRLLKILGRCTSADACDPSSESK